MQVVARVSTGRLTLTRPAIDSRTTRGVCQATDGVRGTGHDRYNDRKKAQEAITDWPCLGRFLTIRARVVPPLTGVHTRRGHVVMGGEDEPVAVHRRGKTVPQVVPAEVDALPG